MDHFQYRDGQLYVEDIAIDDVVRDFGSPVYVYSQKTLVAHYQKLKQAFADIDPLICYSIKSLANVNICRLLASEGAGMDVVSGGELHRAMTAGCDPAKVVYAGVGKTDLEIEAALTAGENKQGIGYFNIESEAEFENIASIAKRMGVTGRGALRVNPDVSDPNTHAKTTTGKKETKFGVDIERAKRFFETYGKNEHLNLCAIHLHIGSPIYSAEPYVNAIKKALELVDELKTQGYEITAIDMGGGFAADYETGKSPAWTQYADAIVPLLKPFHDAGGKIILEPGRTISANSGVLLTEVQYIKQGGNKQFVIVDSGMHHLIRPTIYEAFHFVWPTRVDQKHVPQKRSEEMDLPDLEVCDVVGPICETGDYFALNRAIPPVKRGDLICVFSAGAYGMVMASHYNSVPNPAEVLVSGSEMQLIRRRETYDDLLAAEMALSPGTIRL